MTNPVNVEFISERLIEFLSGTTDLFLKRQLTTRVCTIAERYAPNNSWYIRTITKLFEVSGDMVTPEVAQNLMSLIAEGTGESEEADMLLRQTAVEIYVALLKEKPLASLPRILLETMAWCLGEYGYLSAVSSLDDVLLHLCQFAKTHKAKLSSTTRKFLVSAIMKLVAQAGTCPSHAAAVIDDYTKSCDVDLQQRCLEFQNLLTNCPNLLPEILPVDASAEDLQVDMNLSFLDGYVQQSLANGARPYDKPEDDDDEEDDYGGMANGSSAPAFKMTPYEKPQAPSGAIMSMSGVGSASGPRSSGQAGVSLPPGAAAGGSSTLPAPPQQQAGGLSLNTRNVANVWGRGGMNVESPTAPAGAAGAPPPGAAPAPAGAPSTSSWGNTPADPSSNPYGTTAVSAPAPPPPEPVKTAEQLEKERMAAALFGGIVPGAAPPPPPPPQPAAPPKQPSAPPAQVAAPPVSAPAPPAPEVDLLDMGAWDAPSTASAPAPAAADATDAFSAQQAAAPPPASGDVIVETVSDDGADAYHPEHPQAAAAAPPPAPAEDVDPFASAGLLSEVEEKPLASLASPETNQKFEFHGSPMAPLQITTAQFGQQWGSCPATSPVSVQSSKTSTLIQFMDVCANVGCYKVETISATNEGICAGMLGGGSQIVLIHGKVAPLGPGQCKIDATIKSTDQTLCGSLAMYLQTLLR